MMAGENPKAPATTPVTQGTPGPALTTPVDAGSTNPPTPGTLPGTVVPVRAESPHRGSAYPSIPGYEITGEIARGGMGLVYAARDTSLSREVAIKTLLPQLAGRRDLAAEFDREAHITAQLQHPGVPPVHELGTLPDGTPFLAMKLIRGRTLHHELEATDRVASLPRLLGIFEQICQTVGYAHSVGIIHRDLKTLNVMVGAFGEVQVMDWGLAREMQSAKCKGQNEDTEQDSLAATRRGASEDVSATREGSAKGTPQYMPPEQAKGEWDKVDARADVFSLGGILCVILRGKPPYTGTNVRAVLTRAIEADLGEAFSRLDSCGADAELVVLCKRCLSANREDRPEDGKVLADAIAAYRARVEERARKAETERVAAEAEAREQRKRRKVQLALAASLGLLIAAGGAFAWWQQREAEDRKLALAKADADIARSEAEAERRQRQVERQILEGRNAATALLTQAESALQANQADTAERALTEAGNRINESNATDLQLRAERVRADLTMLRTLIEIDNFRWSVDEGEPPRWAAVQEKWVRAFEEYGFTSTDTLPEAVRRIDASFIRERLLTSLEVLALGNRGAGTVRQLLSAADPDSFREEARATNYQQALLKRAFRGNPVRVAQPVWFATAHGTNRALDLGPREHLLLTAHQARPDSFPILMSLGMLYQAKDRESSLRMAGWFRAATIVQPNSPAAWNALGNALSRLNETAGAIDAYSRASRINLKFGSGYFNLGRMLAETGDLKGAIAAYREALHREPGDALTHNNLGNALHASGDVPGAFAEFREAIRLDPKFTIAHYNLAKAHRLAGELPAAIAKYQEAISLDHEYAPAYTGLGIALFDSRDYRGAVLAHSKAVELDHNNPSYHSNLANALKRTGEIPKAIAEYREAIRLDPKDMTTRFNLGVALAESGDLPGAITAYREAIRINPNDPKTHTSLGNALSRSGDKPGAIAAYREAVRLDPDYAGAYYNLGVTLNQMGDTPGAIAAFREACRANPKLAASHSALAGALLNSGDAAGAIAAFQQALKLDPKNAEIHANFAGACVHAKKYPEAIAAAREAIKLNPKIARAHASLGIALQLSGDTPAAKIAFAEAVRLDPNAWGPEVPKLFPLPVAPPPRVVQP